MLKAVLEDRDGQCRFVAEILAQAGRHDGAGIQSLPCDPCLAGSNRRSPSLTTIVPQTISSGLSTSQRIAMP